MPSRPMLIGGSGLAVCGLVLAGTGCGGGAEQVVKDPEGITLKSALADVGEGLAEMVKRSPEAEYGLYPSEVVVVFNVTASGATESKLRVTGGSSGTSEAGVAAAAEMGKSNVAGRSNTITVRFQNMLFAPRDSLLGSTTGAELFRIRQAILGYNPELPMPNVPAAPAAPADAPAQPEAADPNAASGPASAPTAPGPLPVALAAASAPMRQLPAMKFMSPVKPEDDPTQYVDALEAERLRALARALNQQAGFTLADPAAEIDALRGQVKGVVRTLALTRQEVERFATAAGTNPKP